MLKSFTANWMPISCQWPGRLLHFNFLNCVQGIESSTSFRRSDSPSRNTIYRDLHPQISIPPSSKHQLTQRPKAKQWIPNNQTSQIGKRLPLSTSDHTLWLSNNQYSKQNYRNRLSPSRRHRQIMENNHKIQRWATKILNCLGEYRKFYTPVNSFLYMFSDILTLV